jgi:hypothetical protein
MRLPTRLATTLSPLALVLAGASDPLANPTADVAVAPFTVEHDSAGVLRTIADTCSERLVSGLTAKGIAVVRLPHLSEKTLHSARPIPLAVLGHLSREQGQFRAELRLLEVESGEEQRSYFNADKDPAAVANLGAAAAVRIAGVIEERKGPHRAP